MPKLSNFFLPKDWNHQDTLWVLSMFGTAVGAGVLFLPINAGLSGFWPLLLMSLLVWKMTYFAHRGLARLVLSSSEKHGRIIDVVNEHYGEKAGHFLTLLYFLAIYPIVLIYGVGITNTVEHMLVHEFGLVAPPRIWLSLGLILLLMSVMWGGKQIMLMVTEYLVYPLVVCLVLISLYLVPYWNLGTLTQTPCLSKCLSTLWITIPVLIFSFNHSPIISEFAGSQRESYGNQAEKKTSQILSRTATMLLGFVMLFVFSCVLSLEPSDLLKAKEMNVSILSYLSTKFHTPFLAYLGSPISLLAIMSSFFGHYVGAKEGLIGLLTFHHDETHPGPSKTMNICVTLFIVLTTWITATLNPSILGMIETLSGPIIAIVLFILPSYSVYRVASLKKYRKEWSNAFILIVGILALLSSQG